MEPQPKTLPVIPAQSVEQKPPHPNKKLKIILLVFLFLLLAATLVFGYQLSQQKPQDDLLVPPVEPTPTQMLNEASEWKTYRNEAWGYSIDYPSSITPRIISTPIYLNSILFGDPNDREKSLWFSIGITDKTLEEQIKNTRVDAQVMIPDQVTKLPITHDIYHGMRIDVAPNDTSFVLNNGVFSYTINTSTKYADQVLSTFKFLDNFKVHVPTNYKECISMEGTLDKNDLGKCIYTTLDETSVPFKQCQGYGGLVGNEQNSSNNKSTCTLTIYAVTGTIALHDAWSGPGTGFVVSATSAEGRVTEMRVWTDTNKDSEWKPFSKTVGVIVGNDRDVYIQFKDQRGNRSKVYTTSAFWAGQ